jgi:hypothetical protein
LTCTKMFFYLQCLHVWSKTPTQDLTCTISTNTLLLFFFVVRGPRSWCYGRTTALRLFVQPLWWRWAVFYQALQVMEHQWNEIDRGKPTTRRKTYPSATLSTINLTWTWPGIEPGPPWWEAGD